MSSECASQILVIEETPTCWGRCKRWRGMQLTVCQMQVVVVVVTVTFRLMNVHGDGVHVCLCPIAACDDVTIARCTRQFANARVTVIIR